MATDAEGFVAWSANETVLVEMDSSSPDYLQAILDAARPFVFIDPGGEVDPQLVGYPVIQCTAYSQGQELSEAEGRLDEAPAHTWTCAQLRDQSEQVARALLHRFEPGDRIAVWAHNIPEWALLQFGTSLFTVDEHYGNPMLAMAQAALGGCPGLETVVRFADWAQFCATGSARERLAPHDTQALDHRRRVPPHRFGQDPGVRPPSEVGTVDPYV